MRFGPLTVLVVVAVVVAVVAWWLSSWVLVPGVVFLAGIVCALSGGRVMAGAIERRGPYESDSRDLAADETAAALMMMVGGFAAIAALSVLLAAELLRLL